MRERYLIAIATMMVVTSAALIFSFKYPPLLDYPNHLARMFILSNQTDPILSEFYRIQVQVPTNLAMEMFIPVLDIVFPLSVAGKIFIILTITLFIFAPLFISKTLYGEIHVLALLPSLFLFSSAFSFGFLNFLFSAIVALYCFAFYLKLDRDQSKYLPLIGCAIPVLLFLLHVYGFLVYAACIGSHYIVKYGRTDFRALAIRGVQFVPAAGLLAYFVMQSATRTSSASEQTGQEDSQSALSALDVAGIQAIDSAEQQSWVPYRIRTLWDRFAELWAHYGTLEWAILVLLIGVASLYVWRRKWPAAPALIAPVLVLLALVVFLPNVLFGAAHVNWRFVIPAALLAGGVAIKLSLKPVESSSLAALIGALFVVQLSLAANTLQKSNAYQTEVIAALNAVPEGSSVFPVFPSGGSLEAQQPITRTHVATLGVIENRLFVPTLFAFSTQQPLAYTEDYGGYPHRVYYKNFDGIDWRPIGEAFDYVLVLDHDGELGGSAAEWAQRIPLETVVHVSPTDELALLQITERTDLLD